MAFAATIELSGLNGSNGFQIDGEAASDNSGRSVSGAGDVNGDGFADLIVGAHTADPNGSSSGASYVVFGKASGFAAVLQFSDLNGTNGFAVNGVAAVDNSGASVSTAGDVNGDGFDDVIVGADGADPNGSFSGASYVVFGKASGFGADFELSGLTGSNGFALNGEAAFDNSGDAVSAAGDVNGDGFDDVIVGAWSADPNGTLSGTSYVVFGKASGFGADLDFSDLNGTNGFAVNGEAASDQSGYSVSGAGDINGDGFDDLIVGARFADPNGTSSGTSYVVFGKSSGFGADLEFSDLSGANGFAVNGGAMSDTSGRSVSTAGDVNGDGIADLIIGAPAADPNALGNSGASYVIFGKTSAFGADLELSDLNGTTGFAVNGVAAADSSGVSVSTAGDVNGDGFDDLIVGAWGADPNASGSGASYVVFGKSSGFGADLELSGLDGSNGFAINGEGMDDRSGLSVSTAGDVNGDYLADVIVGAYGADPNGSLSGASYVVFGQGPDTSVNRTGTVASQTLVGSDQNDTLSGLGGDDTLVGNGGSDILDGGTGADRMFGGAGNDIYTVDNAGDTVSEGGGSGTDLVKSSVSFTLANGVENLTLTGGGNLKGTGNSDKNALTGNGGKNTLKGQNSNDTLKGGNGNDKLFGGKHNDKLFGDNQKDVLKGDDGNDQLFGGKHDDKLFGGKGKDKMNGDAGKDILQGDQGNDKITGGGGTDTAVFAGKINGYKIVKAGSKIKVIDKDGKFGTDVLSGVEKLKFGGKVFTVKKALKVAGPPKKKAVAKDDKDAIDDIPSHGEAAGADVAELSFDTLASWPDDLLM